LLYNDQSVLENLHCAITMSVLSADSCNFIWDLEAQMRRDFRSIVITMILDTDLGKHIQTVSRFRQEFLLPSTLSDDDPRAPLTPAQRKELLSFVLKSCDVAHSTKPFNFHVVWTLSITKEFFAQGDAETEMGLPCSPFCDRHNTRVSESQRGFFDFIVSPLYSALSEYMDSKRLAMEVIPELDKNRNFWKFWNAEHFNYEDPMTNAERMKAVFREWDTEQRFGCNIQKSGSSCHRVGGIRTIGGGRSSQRSVGSARHSSTSLGFSRPIMSPSFNRERRESLENKKLDNQAANIGTRSMPVSQFVPIKKSPTDTAVVKTGSSQ
jgi:hypothetical protein